MPVTEPKPVPQQPTYFWDCRRPLSRRSYVTIGVALMLLKYGVEFAFIRQLTGRFYSPLDFLNPLMNSRRLFLNGAPEWFGTTWLLWTLPFVTVAVVFSVRRAIDVGWSPWLGLVILVPFTNFLLMAALACAPSAAGRDAMGSASTGPLPPPDAATMSFVPFAAMFYGVLTATVYAFVVSLLTIYALDSYGSALFFGTPLVAGAVAAYAYNLRNPHSALATLAVSILPVLCVGGMFLLAALEGIICLIMAAPIVLPLALVGGLVGKGIADSQRGTAVRRNQIAGCLIALPMIALAESRFPNTVEYVVVSSIDVAASPEVVWRQVIDFPPIDSPQPWLFRLGIAGPESAAIEGAGVGAIRRCVFTTGSFVEPITAWDEPHRLAFDVTEQPEPMFELTPYRHVHPPHLEGSFRSTRGEFVLEPLADGGTRLVGRTWYRLELAPHAYWTVWTDWIIHRIHGRVLDHIKELSEATVE